MFLFFICTEVASERFIDSYIDLFMQILILNRLIIFILLFLLGVNCEIDIDECINNTCQFGSTCDDKINYYTCICAPGYHGDKCEIEINDYCIISTAIGMSNV